MKDKVRIGIVGAGWVARERHLPALTTLPEVILEVIWSPDGQNARRLASEWNISKVAGDWQEITASKTVDAVVIATRLLFFTTPCVSGPCNQESTYSVRHDWRVILGKPLRW